jgi:hypothetical protein
LCNEYLLKYKAHLRFFPCLIINSTSYKIANSLTTMAHRVSVRYLAAKLAASAEEVAIQMQNSATTGLTEALAKGMEAFRRQLTGVGVVTGISMAPTLNADALTKPDAAEKFLMRLIPRPVAQRSVFDGDVIAFTSPLVSPGSTVDQIMVRRVAALEGEELVSDEPEEEGGTMVIPEVRK